MRSLFLTVSLCIVYVFVQAQNNKKIKVLFLGNSYTYVNNLPQLVHDIAMSNGDTLLFDSNTPGGYTLNNHFNDVTSIAKINSQSWDYVVLQAQSQEPSFSPSQVAAQTLPYALALDSVINLNDSCTITVFYETWGRKNGDASNCPVYPPVCTYTGMQDRLKESYKLFADTCHALMSPAGEAWRKSIDLNPTLNLYQADESHPSLEGSYLTACVFYEVLFGKSVLNNFYTAGISAITADSLQQIAHDVVNDSLVIWNIGHYYPCNTTSGIQPDYSENTFVLSPNPAGNILNLSFPEEWKNKSVTYKISDMTGRVFLQGKLASGSISVSVLPAGLYFIEIRNEGKSFTRIFLKEIY